MTPKKSGVRIIPGHRFDVNNVRVDLRRLFSSLIKLVASAGTAIAGNEPPMKTFLDGLVDASEAFSVSTPIEVLGWHLVFRSTAAALGEIISGWDIREKTQGDASELLDRLGTDLSQVDIIISDTFFENPGSLPIVRVVQDYFRDWLIAIGAGDRESGALAARFPSYFAFALHNEWRKGREKYFRLLESIQTPFDEAVALIEEWERYRASLVQQVHQPIFGEAFSLKQIHVPLRASFKTSEKTRRRGGTEGGEDSPGRRMAIVDLQTELLNWSSTATRDTSILMIRGGPGSGKSSSVRMFAAHLMEARLHRVIYIPMQRFLIHERLTEAIGTYLTNSEAFQKSPLDQREFASKRDRLILIFDGLDELTKPGENADLETRRFLHELRTTLAQWNANQCRVLAVVTGRTAVVQSASDAVRVSARQDLTVVNLFIPQYLRGMYSGKGALVKEDQRFAWWKNYVAHKSGEQHKLPEILLSYEFQELTSEPLLLYLLVLSGYHKIAGASSINRNEVYQRLFSEVQERRYEGEPVEVRRALRDDFEDVMEAIATAAWYGDGRTASIQEVRARCSERVRAALERVIASGGVHRLIAAFYFQTSERSKAADAEAFEFTHKSFGEYLTSRRIVKSLRGLAQQLSTKSDFFTPRRALESWVDLCGHQPLDSDLYRFLIDELTMPNWRNDIDLIQDLLAQFAALILEFGVSTSAIASVPFREAEATVRNAEEAAFALLAATKSIVPKVTQLKWVTPHSAGELVHRFRRQRWVSDDSISMRMFSFLDFTSQSFMNSDLFGANFTGSICRECNFYLADLRAANFSLCDLRNTDLSGATIDRADFTSANLASASMNRIRCSPNFGAGEIANDFRQANLEDCRAIEADLREADFSGANLRRANFSKSWLQGSKLSAAKLEGAILDGAYLAGSDVSEEYLRSVGASIVETDFSTTNDIDRADRYDERMWLERDAESNISDGRT